MDDASPTGLSSVTRAWGALETVHVSATSPRRPPRSTSPSAARRSYFPPGRCHGAVGRGHRGHLLRLRAVAPDAASAAGTGARADGAGAARRMARPGAIMGAPTWPSRRLAVAVRGLPTGRPCSRARAARVARRDLLALGTQRRWCGDRGDGHVAVLTHRASTRRATLLTGLVGQGKFLKRPGASARSSLRATAPHRGWVDEEAGSRTARGP